MNYDCDHGLFMALHFNGGPVMDQIMLIISGTAMWIPLYLLILFLVWKRGGWRNVVIFVLCMVAAIVLSDMIAGIFKHSGPLKHLWASFPPRPRPMFTPVLEGLSITPDSLSILRRSATAGIDWTLHVPQEALAGMYGTVSSHAATIAALSIISISVIRRRWFSWLMVISALLICYSRIYLSKHFPIDLLLGAGTGLLTGWAMYRLYRFGIKKLQKN